MVIRYKFRQKAEERNFSEEDVEVNTIYASTAFEKISVVDIVELRPARYFGFGVHSLAEKDRLGNPDLDFPIGSIFGDRDIQGSEAIDSVIKNSKHFATGRSQLFKLEDCGHVMNFD